MQNKNLPAFCTEGICTDIWTDIWTERGMTSSYIGVSAYSFLRHDNGRHCVTLAACVFPHPHMVRKLVDEILKEWDIDQSYT